MERKLSVKFLNSFKSGIFMPLLKIVREDDTLDMQAVRPQIRKPPNKLPLRLLRIRHAGHEF